MNNNYLYPDFIYEFVNKDDEKDHKYIYAFSKLEAKNLLYSTYPNTPYTLIKLYKAYFKQVSKILKDTIIDETFASFVTDEQMKKIIKIISKDSIYECSDVVRNDENKLPTLQTYYDALTKLMNVDLHDLSLCIDKFYGNVYVTQFKLVCLNPTNDNIPAIRNEDIMIYYTTPTTKEYEETIIKLEKSIENIKENYEDCIFKKEYENIPFIHKNYIWNSLCNLEHLYNINPNIFKLKFPLIEVQTNK